MRISSNYRLQFDNTEEKTMFYKILFILTLFNLIKTGKNFIQSNVIMIDGKAEVSTRAYISMGVSMLFYVMVIALCFIPSLLW